MSLIDLRTEQLTLPELQRLVANLLDYLELDVERPRSTDHLKLVKSEKP